MRESTRSISLPPLLIDIELLLPLVHWYLSQFNIFFKSHVQDFAADQSGLQFLNPGTMKVPKHHSALEHTTKGSRTHSEVSECMAIGRAAAATLEGRNPRRFSPTNLRA